MALREAGPEFWGHSDHNQIDQEQGTGEGLGYSFLMFDGEQDGEDVKAEFKAQLSRVEECMSEQQREEVVQEARYIFQACIEMVEELDAWLATPSQTKIESGSKGTKEAKEIMVTAVTASNSTVQKKAQSGMTTAAAPLLLALALVLLFITMSEPVKWLLTYTGYAYSYD